MFMKKLNGVLSPRVTLVRGLFSLGLVCAGLSVAQASGPQSFDPSAGYANRFIFCESLNGNNGSNNDQTQDRIRIDLAGVDKVVAITRNGVSQEITEIRKVPGGTTEVTALSFDPIGAMKVSMSSNDLIFASSGEIKVGVEVMGAPGTEIQKVDTHCAVFP